MRRERRGFVGARWRLELSRRCRLCVGGRSCRGRWRCRGGLGRDDRRREGWRMRPGRGSVRDWKLVGDERVRKRALI